MVKISKVLPGATTLTGEERRKDAGATSSSPGIFETIRMVNGIVYKVHESFPLVKVYDSRDGSVVANDKWIPLSHSSEEIIERFGTIRTGMVVAVTYYGPDGLNATARIILGENEKLGEEELAVNEMETGLWEIFKPGI